MDKHPYYREADTGIIEIKRLLECLLANNYKFEGTSEKYQYPDDTFANFSKSLEFTATDGNLINDNSINVSIQFQKRVDYKHFKQDENEDDIYMGDTDEFIQGLIDETEKKLRKRRRTHKIQKTRRSRSATISKRAASI